MQLFYAPDITPPLYELSQEEAHHAVRVLRLGVGETMHLTDGRGNLYRAEVVEADKKCVVRIVETVSDYEKRPFGLTIAVAPPKNSERWEWFVEKAVETGVDRIAPLNCVHSERRSINVARTEKVITEAMKQSLKAYRPVLDQITKFADFVRSADADIKLIAHCRPTERTFIGKVSGVRRQVSDNIIILIGPEGDFSVEEIDFAVQHGFCPITLGGARLRTETAALAAVTISNFMYEAIPE